MHGLKNVKNVKALYIFLKSEKPFVVLDGSQSLTVFPSDKSGT
jgi:hypothetical protein